MGHRHGTSIRETGHQRDIDRDFDMEYGFSIWDMLDRYGYIDMVILDIDMGYALMIWEMTVSMWSSSISTWDILPL